MFRKPFKVKSNNAIRGSERRKLRDHVNKSFPFLSPEDISLLVPNKEAMSIMNISAHNETAVTCYCLLKTPVLFDVGGTLLPTVYTLWKYPHMTLAFQTSPNVFSILAGGADFMFPGVTSPLIGYPDFVARTPCYITLIGNGAAVAVGITSCSKQDLVQGGLAGKRVTIFHCFKDHLWAIGEKEAPPLLPQILYNESENEVNGLDEVEKNGGDVNGGTVEDESQLPITDDVKALSVSCETEDNHGGEEDGLNGHSPEEEEHKENEDDVKVEDAVEVPKLTPQEQMDLLLQNCFCQALLDAKKIELPILVSKFSSQYLHASCPDGMRIDVKKSSYKKMSKFLAEKQSSGLVVVKELSKGVESITAMDIKNDEIMKYSSSEFAKNRKVVKQEKLEEEKEMKKQLNKTIEVKELFAVSAKVIPFFKLYQISKGVPLSRGEVRQLVTRYVKEKELINTQRKQLINLDPLLTDMLFAKGDHQDALTWDGIMTRMLERMNPCHEVICPGEDPVLRKGKMENIDISIEQRMGNKKVTVIKNLESFGIDTKAFAQALQQAAASSTAVNPMPGKNASGHLVIVQGDQIKHLKPLLESHKVPLKYVKGLLSKKK